jgi:hypothetical protein
LLDLSTNGQDALLLSWKLGLMIHSKLDGLPKRFTSAKLYLMLKLA